MWRCNLQRNIRNLCKHFHTLGDNRHNSTLNPKVLQDILSRNRELNGGKVLRVTLKRLMHLGTQVLIS
jgi:hypothetical protein